jgi:hypothetical protein
MLVAYNITQQIFHCFGDTYFCAPSFIMKGQAVQEESSWTAWPLKVGPIACPKMLVRNYHSTLHKITRVEVKVQFTVEQDMKAQRGSSGIALLCL